MFQVISLVQPALRVIEWCCNNYVQEVIILFQHTKTENDVSAVCVVVCSHMKRAACS